MQGIINSIVRPTMISYSISDLGLNQMTVNEHNIKRIDKVVQSIPISYYAMPGSTTTIVYAHSYNSNRLEAMSMIRKVLQHHINILTFDFQRVLYSEHTNKVNLNHNQGYISFGFYQHQQLEVVIKWLKAQVQGKVFIWGRSMGAVCALLHQSKSQQCDGLILDSPFHSLKETFVNQLCQISKVPKFISQSVVFVCNQYFKKLLNFDLSELNILERLKIKCAVFVMVNPKDSLSGQSSNLIYNRCQGYRKLYFSEAEHSGSREPFIIEDILSNISAMNKPIISKYSLKEDYKLSNSHRNIHSPYERAEQEGLKKSKKDSLFKQQKGKERFLKIYQSKSPKNRLKSQVRELLPTEQKQQKQTFLFCNE